MIKLLINGEWHSAIEDTQELRQIRSKQKQNWFRDWVTADGESGFQAQPGRYHLYISYACPWAHRTILYRALKGLQKIISMSVLHPRWAGPNGWEFGDSAMSSVDHINGKNYLHEI